MAPSAQDFVKGVDVTGLPEVNDTELNQLVDAAVVANDRGLIIASTDSALDVPDVPDPNADPAQDKWKRYVWKRTPDASATDKRPMLYQWEDDADSDATLLKWKLIVQTNDWATGSYNAGIYTLTRVGRSFKQHTAGNRIAFLATAASAGATVLTIDGLAAKQLRLPQGPTVANSIANGALVEAVYNGTYYIIVSRPGLLTTGDYADESVTLSKILASARMSIGLGAINVMDPSFGAVGDGSTDDTAAVTAAIAAFVALGGGTLFFPAGKNFNCPTLTARANGIVTALEVRNDSATAIPVIVSGFGAKLTSTTYVSGGLSRRVWQFTGNFTQVRVFGLDLRNDRADGNLDLGGGGESGWFNVAGTAYTVTDFEVAHCKFNDWGNWGIEVWHTATVHRVQVHHNTFLASVGSDCAHVGIRINQYSDFVDINHNFFDGAVGSVATNTNKFGAGGLYDGYRQNFLNISDNFILHPGYEGLIVQLYTGLGYPSSTTYPSDTCLIRNNIIDGSVPTGAAATQFSYFGIRADAPGMDIGSNTIFNCDTGIASALGSGVDPAVQLAGARQRIVDNRIYVHGGDGSQGIACGASLDSVYRDNLIYIIANTGTAGAGNDTVGIRFSANLTGVNRQCLRNLFENNRIQCGTRTAGLNKVSGIVANQGYRDGKVIGNHFENLDYIYNSVNGGNPAFDNNIAVDCAEFATGQYQYATLGRMTFTHTPTAGTTGWFTVISNTEYMTSAKVKVMVPWWYGCAEPSDKIFFTPAVGQRGQQTEVAVEGGFDWDFANPYGRVALLSHRANRITGGTITAFRAADGQLQFYLAAATLPAKLTWVVENYTPGVNLALTPTAVVSVTDRYSSLALVDCPPLTTTNATLTQLTAFLPEPGGVITVRARVTAKDAAFTEGASYEAVASFLVTDVGVVSQLGTTTEIFTHESDAAYAIALATDTANITLKVTGDATPKTLVWNAAVEAVGRH